MDNIVTIYTDGGSRGNPGKSAYGVVVYYGTTKIIAFGKTIGITTNNVAEYTAILEALRWVCSHRESIGDFTGIICKMDSLLACQQLNSIYKIKNLHLAALIIQIRMLEKQINIRISYIHIPREKNKEADAQVNQALDNMI